MKRTQSVVLGMVMTAALLLAIGCDTEGASGGGVSEHPDLTPLTHRETVSMSDAAGVKGGFLTDEDGTNDYVEVRNSVTSFEHKITPFVMGKYEVTYELWYTVLIWAKANGYTFAISGREGNDGTIGDAPTADGKLEPATCMNWRDAIVWCNAYSEMAGLRPCYYTDNTLTTVLRTSSNSSTISAVNGDILSDCVNWNANGYRLPTVGEWLYAASCAGTYPYDYASGADAACDAVTGGIDNDHDGDVDYTDAVAWSSSNSGTKTHPVGDLKANRYGLFDMSGNALEMCWDWHGSSPSGDQRDYTGADSGPRQARVCRSASFGNDTCEMAVENWGPIEPDLYGSGYGLRVVRRP